MGGLLLALGHLDVTCWLHNVSSGSLCASVPVPLRDGSRGGKNLNALVLLPMEYLGNAGFILSGEAFYSCSRALLPCHRSELRNILEISFELCLGRRKRCIMMHWTTSSPSWLPWCSLARWLCLMPAVVFTMSVFSSPPQLVSFPKSFYSRLFLVSSGLSQAISSLCAFVSPAVKWG